VEALALSLTFAVHVLGAIVLVWAMLDEDTDWRIWRGWWPDDGDQRPEPGAPTPPGGDGLPLPDAAPARVRLRGHERLRDTVPPPARRPEHVPAPEREPDRTPA
jgi:hypothetical protein